MFDWVKSVDADVAMGKLRG